MEQDLAPYIPIIGTYDSSGDKTFRQIAETQINRLNLLKSKIGAHYRLVEKGPLGLPIWNFTENRNGNQISKELILLPLVYDVRQGEIYVVCPEKDHTKFAEFVNTILNGQKLSSHKIVNEHLSNIAKYSKNKYISQIKDKLNTITKMMCVDSRYPLSIVGKTVKELGACLTDSGLTDLMQSFGEIFKIIMHTNCGYVRTALSFNNLMEELNKMREKRGTLEDRIVCQIFEDIDMFISSNKVVKRDKLEFEDMLKILELSNENKELIKELYGTNGNGTDGSIYSSNDTKTYGMWRVIKHLMGTGLMVKRTDHDKDGHHPGFYFPSIHTVKTFLETNKAEVNEEKLLYLITEELAREMYKKMLKINNENKLCKKIEVHILNLRDGKHAFVPSELTMADLGFEREQLLGIDDHGEIIIKKEPVNL